MATKSLSRTKLDDLWIMYDDLVERAEEEDVEYPEGVGREGVLKDDLVTEIERLQAVVAGAGGDDSGIDDVGGEDEEDEDDVPQTTAAAASAEAAPAKPAVKSVDEETAPYLTHFEATIAKFEGATIDQQSVARAKQIFRSARQWQNSFSFSTFTAGYYAYRQNGVMYEIVQDGVEAQNPWSVYVAGESGEAGEDGVVGRGAPVTRVRNLTGARTFFKNQPIENK